MKVSNFQNPEDDEKFPKNVHSMHNWILVSYLRSGKFHAIISRISLNRQSLTRNPSLTFFFASVQMSHSHS